MGGIGGATGGCKGGCPTTGGGGELGSLLRGGIGLGLGMDGRPSGEELSGAGGGGGAPTDGAPPIGGC